MTESAYQPINSQQSRVDESSNIKAKSSRRNIRKAVGCDFLGGIYTLIKSQFGQYLPNGRIIAGYFSGFLFAVGWWLFIDGAAFSISSGHEIAPVPVRFEDWIPGIMSTIALIIVNLINREMLTGEDGLYNDTNVATKARAIAFISISLALSSLGCALAILFVKYVIPGYTSGSSLYFGLCITLQNFLIFIGSMVLWFGRYGGSDEGSISL